ncbi:TDT family transporter [Streptomyces sp. NPDC057486]|uniref:SLAC1 family transporter n=1 Tax=Streptomyces sp. NPDC057486 TaxID=3346145 RepID=UPI0036AB9BD0
MAAVDPDRAPPQRGRSGRITPSLFSIAFGLAGLGQAWHAAGPILGTPGAVPDALYLLAAGVWLVLVVAYAVQGPRRMLADLRDPVQSSFPSLAAITPMMLGAALATAAYTAGRIVVMIFLAMTMALGGWLTGQWIAGDLDTDALHPGYYLPATAGGFVGAAAAAHVHLRTLAEASFGIGILSWLLVGSLLMNRLFVRPMLPQSLVPTLAIESTPPAIAGVAYFALTGVTIDFAAAALGGFAALMALAQLRLVPLYARLRFSTGFWSFTFAYAAGATDALLWLTATEPPGATVYAVVVIVLITALIAGIAARTVVAAVRGQLLAPPPPAWGPQATARGGDRRCGD